MKNNLNFHFLIEMSGVDVEALLGAAYEDPSVSNQ